MLDKFLYLFKMSGRDDEITAMTEGSSPAMDTLINSARPFPFEVYANYLPHITRMVFPAFFVVNPFTWGRL
jgi:hypothetical protein